MALGRWTFAVLFVCLVFYIRETQAGVSDWYYRCCTKGETKAAAFNGNFAVCDKDDLDSRRFPKPADRLICRLAERICCTKKLQKISCDRGRYEALKRKQCVRPNSCSTSDRFVKCCDCCALGIKTAQDGNLACDGIRMNGDSLCQKVYTSCCNGKNITVQPGVPYTFPPPIQATRPPTIATEKNIGNCINYGCQHVCREDRRKTPVCYCYNGYLIESDGKSCLDVNECVRDPNLCKSGNKKCVNTPGSYRCVASVQPTPKTCSTGYAYKQGSCQDIDECARGRQVCGGSSKCENTAGSYRCVPCGSGYRLRNNNCEDIDECSERLYRCNSDEKCQNTPGSYVCIRRLTCPSGYRPVRDQCVDVDECARDPNLCKSGNKKCVNTPGSYRCDASVQPTPKTCSAGYAYKQGSCRDIDECSERRYRCNSDEKCQNTPGSYVCIRRLTCPSGYRPVRDQCVDINECAENTHRCPSNQVCQNYRGSYRCANRPAQACPKGYQRGSSGQCEDIDECSSANDCSLYSTCTNNPGSYQCRCNSNFQGDGKKCYPKPNRKCPRGFRNTGGLCVDIDECAEGLHSCISSKICENTRGSYTCKNRVACANGYTRGRSGKCEDINECLYVKCSSNQDCKNRPGTYQCVDQDPCSSRRCPSGYKCNLVNNIPTCQDIDECLKNPCSPGEKCFNQPGGYYCRCQPGYKKIYGIDRCEDINECANYVCQHNCKNTPGSYQCSCRSGYKLRSTVSGLQGLCVNIDECVTQNPCQGQCRDTPGSYQCFCDPGFRLNLDGRTCREIDECVEGAGRYCAQGCTNTVGSFRCTCRSGWKVAIDSSQCIDKNECEENPNICGSGRFCANKMGSYECIPFSCPPRTQIPSVYVRYYKWQTRGRKCIKKKCTDGDVTCYGLTDKSFSLWTFNRAVGTGPEDLFTYRIILQGYRDGKQPVLNYRFKSGNEQKLFEIQGPNSINSKVFIRNKDVLTQAGSYRLEFVAELFWPDGKLVSRYFHYLYVFVHNP